MSKFYMSADRFTILRIKGENLTVLRKKTGTSLDEISNEEFATTVSYIRKNKLQTNLRLIRKR